MNDNIERVKKKTISINGESSFSDDAVLKEHTLSVFVNEVRTYSLVCTKMHLKELVVGRLFTEGLIDSPSEIEKLYFCPSANEARVFLNHEIKWDEWNGAEPSCCTSNRSFLTKEGSRRLKEVPSLDWKPEWIFAMAQKFSNGVELHRATQGTHSCFLSFKDDFLFFTEDIGRHNAIDKAIGYALLNEKALSECILFTSGRVPVDMVQKVVSAGIPVLVTKAVPTEDSLLLAKEYGLTLICRAYPDQFEIFEAESHS